jgi:hypothetical protein
MKKLYVIIFLGFYTFNINAQTWDTIHSGISPFSGTQGYFVDAILEDNADVYVAGKFTFDITNGLPAYGIAKWDGVSWSPLGTGIFATGPGAGVASLIKFNGELYAAGSFTTAGGVTANHIAKWNGASWSALGTGTNGSNIFSLAVYKNELYAAGNFTTAGGITAPGIAKWNGSSWSAVGSGVSNSLAIIVYNEELYISNSSGLYTWDGANLSSLSTISATHFIVYNTDLYASGNFTNVGVNTNIAKWNGVSWTAIGTEAVNNIYSLAFYNGQLYAGGAFTSQGGVLCNNIAKWDGAAWSALGTGTDDKVQAMTVHNGALYVGGSFYTAGDISVDFIAKWTDPSTTFYALTTSTIAGCSNGNNGSVSVTPVGGVSPYTYLWSTNDATPTVNNLPVGTYTVTITDVNTNTTTATASIGHLTTLPSAPVICMVSVDSSSQNNIIYWDKTLYTNVDSFIVYRETVSNTYERIGAVSMDSLSMFTDTTRQLYFPFTGDPNIGAYRYKLQIKDSCGNYSPLSLYHNTIYVTQTGSSFNWNHYQIEGQPTPISQLTSYYLLRDNNGTGNWAIIGAVSGSQLNINDPNYASYPNGRWRIETQWSISCVPTRSGTSTRSNIKGQLTTGIIDNELPITLSIYPNPYSGSTQIGYSLNEQSVINIEIYNAIGEKVATLINSNQAAGEYKYDFSAREKGLNAGVYYLKFDQNGRQTMKKIIELN